MANVFKGLLLLLFLFQVGKSYATFNFFDALIYIPFFDHLWKFDADCQVECMYFSLRCFFPASPLSLCRDIRFMHQCCEQFSSTTTTSTSTTTTTTTTTTTSTTPSTTTSTQGPPVGPCSPTPPSSAQMCEPEPGCSLSPYFPFWNKWQRQHGCDHQCWKHCFNPCACKTASNGNCEYHPPTGSCMARMECGEMSFKEGECRRANTFYSIGGLLCRNSESSQTNCENGTTIFAVNINGEAHTDKRGILYEADDESYFEDIYNTRMNSGRMMSQDEDEKLYGNYAFGVANGVDQRQCLECSMRVDDDGYYELSLRTLEPAYDDAGQRCDSKPNPDCSEYGSWCALFKQ